MVGLRRPPVAVNLISTEFWQDWTGLDKKKKKKKKKKKLREKNQSLKKKSPTHQQTNHFYMWPHVCNITKT
eukprot:NODE_12210_length_1239_cov_3.321043.p6 GENE.NODE_12210_length_1239_cov_3.321043~~NODE_12210_length_1239_cov_3.321043.p6  ORF type:complete len:71 (+),score=25.56 NODE_12210_length_1239_cov_3.321043:1001-1213(+)